MRRLAAAIKKELRQFLRDRLVVALGRYATAE